MKKILFVLIASIVLFNTSIIYSQSDTLSFKYDDVDIIGTIRSDQNTPTTALTLQLSDIDNINFNQEVPNILSYTPSITTYSEMGTYYGYSYYRLRGMDQTRFNI